MMIGETLFEVCFEKAKSLYMFTQSFLLLVIVKRKQSLLEQEDCWVCLRSFLLECGLRNSNYTWELVGRPYPRPWVRIFIVTRVLGESRSNLRHSISDEWRVLFSRLPIPTSKRGYTVFAGDSCAAHCLLLPYALRFVFRITHEIL